MEKNRIRPIKSGKSSRISYSRRLTRKLVGFKMIDRGIPRHGYQIASPEGDIIGQVTSGTMSPCLKQGIGMGYVKKEFAKVGTQIAIVIREKLMKAEVVKLPFIQQK